MVSRSSELRRASRCRKGFVQSWTHGPSSISAQNSSRFETAALTDRLPVAHLASNTHEAGEKQIYISGLSIIHSYSTGNPEAPFISANPFLSFARQLMPVFPVALHISGRGASYQMRDTVTGKVEIERPAASRSRGGKLNADE